MTDGGRRGDFKYRSAARHRAATARKDNEAGWNRQKTRPRCSNTIERDSWPGKAHEFTLVPWRLVIDRQLGREVMGVVQGGSVSWQLGAT